MMKWLQNSANSSGGAPSTMFAMRRVVIGSPLDKGSEL
jgi:hypothetical protein